MTTHTTQTLTTQFASNIADFVDVTVVDGGYTITFDDLAQTLASIDKAKAQSWTSYLKSGGNPRNKRSHSSQFAAIANAVRKAAQ